jgi:hypothetical protein
VGLIWSPLLQQTPRVSNQLMHVTDWLPTLYTAAGQYRGRPLTAPLHPHNSHKQTVPASGFLKGSENTTFRQLDLLTSSGGRWETHLLDSYERAHCSHWTSSTNHPSPEEGKRSSAETFHHFRVFQISKCRPMGPSVRGSRERGSCC